MINCFFFLISSVLNKAYKICSEDITSEKFACTKTKDKSNLKSKVNFQKLHDIITVFKYIVHVTLRGKDSSRQNVSVYLFKIYIIYINIYIE